MSRLSIVRRRRPPGEAASFGAVSPRSRGGSEHRALLIYTSPQPCPRAVNRHAQEPPYAGPELVVVDFTVLVQAVYVLRSMRCMLHCFVRCYAYVPPTSPLSSSSLPRRASRLEFPIITATCSGTSSRLRIELRIEPRPWPAPHRMGLPPSITRQVPKCK